VAKENLFKRPRIKLSYEDYLGTKQRDSKLLGDKRTNQHRAHDEIWDFMLQYRWWHSDLSSNK